MRPSSNQSGDQRRGPGAPGPDCGRNPAPTPEDWRFPWIRATLLLAAVVFLLALVWGNPTGRDVLLASFRLLAGILSTPLLLEGAWFIMGAFVLYLYTLRRRHHDGDEWVVMEVDDAPVPAGRLDPVAGAGTSGAANGRNSPPNECSRG